MNIPDSHVWERMFATDAPQLPSLWLMQVWLHLGWAVVTAWLGCALGQRLLGRRRGSVAVATACAVWAWLPGPYSSSYWLGLAFQMPSISTVLVCAMLLWEQFAKAMAPAHGMTGGKDHRVGIGWVVAGAVFGACLSVDTFALFPVSVYAWGFSGFAVVVAFGVSLLPWVIWRCERCTALYWVAPLAVAWFVVLRLPTGNLWDALLDPWLAVGLTVYLMWQRTSR